MPQQSLLIFYRWLVIAAYGIVGGTVVYFLGPLFAPIAELLADRLTKLPESMALVLSAIIVAVATLMLSAMNTGRLRQFLNLRYPAWIWSVVVGSSFALWLFALGHELPFSLTPVVRLLDLLVPVGVGLFVGSSLASLSNRKAKPTRRATSDDSAKPVPLRDLLADPNRLDEWVLGPEEPLNVLKDDRFGHALIAKRISKHLQDPSATRAIGLVGPFGSGKTSILRGVESLLTHTNAAKHGDRFLVAWAQSWGADSGASAAALILRSAVQELSRHVDALALGDVPAAYRAALEHSGSSILSVLSALVSEPQSPESTLARLDRPLKACRLRLVIFLEDLDRNYLGRERYAEVQALLDRLKQSTERISFVIAIGEQAKQHIDFARICDRYEVLPDAAPSDVERAMRTFVTARLKEYPSDVTWYYDKRGEPIGPDKLDDIDIPAALVNLLPLARTLRATLRRTRLAYNELHGEIDLIELLVVNALRASVPAAFEFLMTNTRELRGHFTRDDEEHRRWLSERWQTTAETLPPSARSAAQAAIEHLFPGRLQEHRDSRETPTPQTIRKGPWSGLELSIGDPVDYWQRMFAEVVDGLRDQDVAKRILDWKSSRDTPAFVRELAASDVFGARFERLVVASTADSQALHIGVAGLYQLADGLHTHILSTRGIGARINGVFGFEGFFAVWRMLIKQTTTAEHLPWVKAKIDSALEISLRFAVDIEYWLSLIHI